MFQYTACSGMYILNSRIGTWGIYNLPLHHFGIHILHSRSWPEDSQNFRYGAGFSYWFDCQMIWISRLTQALRSSLERVPFASSFFRFSRSQAAPGITRSFPARIQPAAVQSGPFSVVVQSVMITPWNPHSQRAAFVHRS